jgi:transcriptional regulator with XRE-family HTH domain
MKHTFTVGEIIRNLRDKAGLSQIELARELQVEQPTVANWEIGRRYPSKKCIDKLATRFDVPKSMFLGE